MNFEFISFFWIFFRSISMAPLYRCWIRLNVRSRMFPRYAATRCKLTVAFNYDDVISPPSRWSWAEADQIQIEIGEFEFLFLLESSRRGKNLTKKNFKIFWTFQKIMRNHLWVIWWVILLLNLLVGDWWWIITMIRQLNCL